MNALVRSLLAALALAHCGPEVDPRSMCAWRSGSYGGAVTTLANVDWIGLFDQSGQQVCRTADVSVTFRGRTAVARSNRAVVATLRGTSSFDLVMGGGPCNVYSTQLDYPSCTDESMEIAVRVSGCQPRLVRTDWFSLERAARAEGVALGQWIIPIQLTCEAEADAAVEVDASTGR